LQQPNIIVRALSDFLYRISNVWTALAITLVYGYFIAIIMPAQSAISAVYAGEWGAPDRHFLYSPDELYAAIATWGAEGRADYINFRLGLDIVWALAYTGFLIAWISILQRGAGTVTLLNVWPIVTLLADYFENALGIILVLNYDIRLNGLAWLAASMTALKWVSLVMAHLILLYALWRYLEKQLRR